MLIVKILNFRRDLGSSLHQISSWAKELPKFMPNRTHTTHPEKIFKLILIIGKFLKFGIFHLP
jgi:hypothetical protein